MIFRVERTSLWSREKPCEGAELLKTSYTRGDGSLREIDAWAVKIDTLEELTRFIETNGGRVVVEYARVYPESPWVIEIYDDYRE
jgi:hypothetical protein